MTVETLGRLGSGSERRDTVSREDGWSGVRRGQKYPQNARPLRGCLAISLSKKFSDEAAWAWCGSPPAKRAWPTSNAAAW